jgi:hypothetical protein
MDTEIMRACQRYERSLRRGEQRLKPGSTILDQVGRYALALGRDRDVRRGTKLVLNEMGVPSISRFLYYGFARGLNRLSRQITPGETLRLEARCLLETWVGRGLDRAVLAEIAAKVFLVHVDVPVQAASCL